MNVYIIEEDRGDTIEQYITKVTDAEPRPYDIVHECKTIKRDRLSTSSMVHSGEKTHPKVISDSYVYEWVGIGWSKQREASITDYYLYPVAI